MSVSKSKMQSENKIDNSENNLDVIEEKKEEFEKLIEGKEPEKLKEKQYKNFLFEYEQSQIKELDDITSSRQKKKVI